MNQLRAIIAASAALSGTVDLQYAALVGIYVPASWTTASITLQASLDGVTFQDVRNAAGDNFELVAGAGNCFVPLAPLELQGTRYVRLRSGTAAVPVTQAAERSLTLVTRIVAS